jgi:hypothetical protein
LHGFSAVILYLLLSSLLHQIRAESSLESNRIIALLASLLFAVHPVNVEAVTWISSRKYGLLAFFYFSSFYFYIKNSEKGRYHRMYYVLSIVSYVLSLLSSPFSVTLPAILFLYDYCRIQDIRLYKIIKLRLLSYLPYVVLSISQFIILWNSFTTTPGPEPAIKSHEMDNMFYTILTMLRVLYDYIKNLTFPFWLNNMYVDYTSTSIFEYKVILSLLVIEQTIKSTCFVSAGSSSPGYQCPILFQYQQKWRTVISICLLLVCSCCFHSQCTIPLTGG